jgi:hypothetical protein
LGVSDLEQSKAFYQQNYYGAFVLDPDGNNIEAVCHRPESGRGPSVAPVAPGDESAADGGSATL